MDTNDLKKVCVVHNRMGKVKTEMGEISFIPEDLLLNILIRLPIKYVLRFRLVCKDWNFLLRSHKFISLHYNHSLEKKHEKDGGSSSSFILLRSVYNEFVNDGDPSRPLSRSILLTSFILTKTSSTSLEVTIQEEEDITRMSLITSNGGVPTDSDKDYMQLFCPFDGLICMANGFNFVFYNPATKEMQMLPSPYPSRLSYSQLVSLELQPCYLGVWFESDMKQYKVFRIVYCEEFCNIEVYNSTVNNWRAIKTIHGRVCPLSCLLFNGVFHFCMEMMDEDDYLVIVTLDAKSEMVGQFELPSFIVGMHISPSYMLPFRGKLAYLEPNILTSDDFDVQSIYCDIWVMTEYGIEQSWTKQCSILLDVIDYDDYESYEHLFCPLAFWKFMDEEENELLMRTYYGNIVTCNLDTHKIIDLNLGCVYHSSTKIVPNNMETFFSLK
ncbi:F-box/kelch-repeat protein At3g06240-like [Impatiens glandulifera]|uniref:F-box/kelch-repeat protein At3g06240-like n=1 Tax=Impatiens glandulifera TaxID=253017 RepID=UPI001FB08616|nr:F-box/kelch-repeat protein At3g06240-like [Impatiens glandulifera]